MHKKLLLVSTFIGVSAVAWTEYRTWSLRSSQRVTPLQLSQYVELNVVTEPANTDESEPVDVIDLTVLQKQTEEPPFAEFLVPLGLPPLADGQAQPIDQTA